MSLPTLSPVARRPTGAGVSTSATRRLSLTVGLLFAATTVITLAAPTATLAWDNSSFSATSESQLVSLTNQARASAGLKALKLDTTLRSVARWRSKDMIDRDYFSHTIPGYGMVWDKLQAIGYCFNVAGENIGWNNYPDDLATSAIQQAFMGSAGHKANILGVAWDVIGIGAYKGPDGKKMWTVLFADKCGSTGSGTTKPAPKPTSHPTARPPAKVTKTAATPRPTPRPTAVRQVATPTPTPTVSPTPPSQLVPVDPATDPQRADATPSPTGADGDATNGVPPQGLRVVDQGSAPGLFETIVGTVTGSFFGG